MFKFLSSFICNAAFFGLRDTFSQKNRTFMCQVEYKVSSCQKFKFVHDACFTVNPYTYNSIYILSKILPWACNLHAAISKSYFEDLHTCCVGYNNCKLLMRFFRNWKLKKKEYYLNVLLWYLRIKSFRLHICLDANLRADCVSAAIITPNNTTYMFSYLPINLLHPNQLQSY